MSVAETDENPKFIQNTAAKDLDLSSLPDQEDGSPVSDDEASDDLANDDVVVESLLGGSASSVDNSQPVADSDLAVDDAKEAADKKTADKKTVAKETVAREKPKAAPNKTEKSKKHGGPDKIAAIWLAANKKQKEERELSAKQQEDKPKTKKANATPAKQITAKKIKPVTGSKSVPTPSAQQALPESEAATAAPAGLPANTEIPTTESPTTESPTTESPTIASSSSGESVAPSETAVAKEKIHLAKPQKRGFADLNLRPEVLQSIVNAGYEKPSAIQFQTIPHVLEGRDLVAQAETGSGKTAAFACPLLSMIDMNLRQPQVLILAPTRELAIQVKEAIDVYAANLGGFRSVCIYGGQSYDGQLKQLKRGVQIVVGTPGRVMDHMRRNTLKLQDLKCLVLDEADEMLRMGFIDDVEWILTMTPKERQILLFSATMPEPIRRIAQQHLTDPKQITVKGRNITADSIQQRYCITSPRDKTDMLTRILEAETTDGVIVFVRTRNQTVEVAEKLVDQGYSAAHLNGDMPQSHRERTVENFRSGRLAVLVATDVAARGLDVNRVSHVINYDFPHDVEAYVHRIGRTGRAGRSGQAILFVGHREKGRLSRIESGTNQRLELMHRPETSTINDKRIANFKQKIVDTAANSDLGMFTKLVQEVQQEHGLSADQIAAALAQIAQGQVPLLMKESPRRKRNERFEDRRGDRSSGERGSSHRGDRSGGRRRSSGDMQCYRIEVGRGHGVGPKNIVGAIANETGVGSGDIGRIEVFDFHSTIELPKDLSGDFFRAIKGVRLGGERVRISKEEGKRFGGKKHFSKGKFDKSSSGPKRNGKGNFKAKKKGKAPHAKGGKPKAR